MKASPADDVAEDAAEGESPNSIELTGDMAKTGGLTDCKVGEDETVIVTFTPTAVNPDGSIEGDIQSVKYGGDKEGAGDTEGTENEPPEPPAKKRPAAVTAAMGY